MNETAINHRQEKILHSAQFTQQRFKDSELGPQNSDDKVDSSQRSLGALSKAQ